MDARYDLRNRLKRKYDLRSTIRGKRKKGIFNKKLNKIVRRRKETCNREEKAGEYVHASKSEQTELKEDVNEDWNKNDIDDTSNQVETIAMEESTDRENEKKIGLKIDPIWTQKLQRAGNKRQLISYSDLDDNQSQSKRNKFCGFENEMLNQTTKRDHGIATVNVWNTTNKSYSSDHTPDNDFPAEKKILKNKCVHKNESKNKFKISASAGKLRHRELMHCDHESGDRYKDKMSHFNLKKSTEKHYENDRSKRKTSYFEQEKYRRHRQREQRGYSFRKENQTNRSGDKLAKRNSFKEKYRRKKSPEMFEDKNIKICDNKMLDRRVSKEDIYFTKERYRSKTRPSRHGDYNQQTLGSSFNRKEEKEIRCPSKNSTWISEDTGLTNNFQKGFRLDIRENKDESCKTTKYCNAGFDGLNAYENETVKPFDRHFHRNERKDGNFRRNYDRRQTNDVERSENVNKRNKKNTSKDWEYRKRHDTGNEKEKMNEKSIGNGKQHGRNVTRSNRQVKTKNRLFIEDDFVSLLTKDKDEVAIVIGTRSDDLEHYLWKKENHTNIKYLVKLLEMVCLSDRKENKKKILYILKERRFFTRYDVMAPITSASMERKMETDGCSYLQSLLTIAHSLVDTIRDEYEEMSHFVTIVDGCTKYLDEENKRDVQAKTEQIIEAIKKNRQDTADVPNDEESNIIDKEILPSIEDIRSNKDYDLKQRQKEKPFENSKEYLSYTFHLFREDFVRPLRKGIRQYIDHLENSEEKNKRFTHDDIRIFENVHIIKCECSKEDGLIWNIRFNVSRYKRVNWNARSLLQYGTLLCLSCDCFRSIMYATVARRNPAELKEGRLHISIFDYPLDSVMPLLNKTFDMIECKASYASYSPPLNVIRNMYLSIEKGDKLPFSSYLVDMDRNIDTPNYLQNNKEPVSLDCISNWKEENLQINILNEFQRPNAEMLGLDISQHEALYLGLTKEIALIQGPPGTGKTVIGLKITNVLLNNASIWNGEPEKAPLLILSYTNHALDQFLEEILEMPVMINCNVKDIVRVGSRTDSKYLEKYNLSKHRREILSNMYIDTFGAKLRGRQFQHEKLQLNIEKVRSGLLHEEYLYNVNIIPKAQYDFLLSCEQSYSVLIKWLNIKGLRKCKLTSTNEYEPIASSRIANEPAMEYIDISDEEDFDIMNGYNSESDTEDNDYYLLTYQRLFKSQGTIESLEPWFAVSEAMLFPENPSQSLDYFSEIDENARKNIAWNIKKKIHDQNRMSESEANIIRDVWCLSIENRWRLYRHWLYMLEKEMIKKKSEHERSYERAQKRYKEAKVMADVRALKRAKVVGMTTTRAARDIEVLQKVGPRIIILEEAAEIPEHHALACISSSCQHLIMIGDHQQLRPAYNDYELSKEFRTNISLFERLIRAKLPFCQLTHQHRMRPEISKLLTPHIYRYLTDHESVLHLNNVRGIATNLFFLSHAELENKNVECESKSHVNNHEANFVCCLYRYLRIQGYRDNDITILTTYKDQMRLIKKIIGEMGERESTTVPEYFDNDIDFSMVQDLEYRRDFRRQNVRVTTVDNFQGEENTIIIISLVRSNIEERIGYLKEANRICVALSRAKNGLYVIGNMSLLEKKSSLWKKILSDAKRRGSVGDSLVLSCQNHPNNKTSVTKLDDFELVKDGGCNQPCKYQRNCGHVCDRLCHPDDKTHEQRCIKECKKTLCNQGHKCKKLCYEKCGLCKEQVTRTLRCGHEQRMPCSSNLKYVKCESRCEKAISCGHRCQKKCGEHCNTPEDCLELAKFKANCGHEFQGPCCTKDNPDCTVPCETKLQCGHICKGKCSTCSQKRLHIPCNHSCDKTLICGHICTVKCSIPCPPCKKNCSVKCSHRNCKEKCGSPCIDCREDCDWQCWKNCPNGFKCEKQCYEFCDRPRCNTPCTRRLQCGHVCPGLLCEKCPNKCLTCDWEELTEIFFGNEDDPNAIFIQLEDCPCVFELDGLDQFMDTVEDETSEISGIKKCPKCRTTIQTSKRYGNRLKLQRKDIESVHRIIDNKCQGDFEKQKECLIEKRLNLQPLFFTLKHSNKVRLSQIILYLLDEEKLRKIKTESELILAENRLNFLSNINSVREQLDRLEDDNDIIQRKRRFTLNRILCLSDWIFKSRHQFCIQELEEFRLEMTRTSVLSDFIILLRDSKIAEISEETEQIITAVDNTTEKLESVNKIPMIEMEKIRNEFDNLRKKVPKHDIGISKKEQIMIIKAMNLPVTGHWYKCKNGHFYAIGECGGAMVQTKCPYCDVIIGGGNHILNADNARATEMEIQVDV